MLGASIHLHVDDCDALAAHAVDCGATLEAPPGDPFYGERSCKVRDPFGHQWLLGHEIEQVEVAEMQRRYDELMARGPVTALVDRQALMRQPVFTIHVATQSAPKKNTSVTPKLMPMWISELPKKLQRKPLIR